MWVQGSAFRNGLRVLFAMVEGSVCNVVVCLDRLNTLASFGQGELKHFGCRDFVDVVMWNGFGERERERDRERERERDTHRPLGVRFVNSEG